MTVAHPESGSSQPPKPRSKTRILILSDTHSALPMPPDVAHQSPPKHPFDQALPHADIAIHCGDLTSTGKPQEHANTVKLLKSLPAPMKIVIAGNHDLTLDRSYCDTHPLLYNWRHPHTPKDLEQARDSYTNKQATDAGIVYLEEGTHTLHLQNGAELTIYVSPYTPEFCDWGFAYPRSIDRFHPSNVNADKPEAFVPGYRGDLSDDANSAQGNKVTVMVTHGPPKGVLDLTTRAENVGCEHLMKAVSRCRPLLHCFGHIHEGWGSEVREWPGHRDTIKDERPRTGGLSSATDSLAGAGDLVELTEEEKMNVGHVDATGLEHGSQTVFVNASIMDVNYVPCQKPWIVDVLLPTASETGKGAPGLK